MKRITAIFIFTWSISFVYSQNINCELYQEVLLVLKKDFSQTQFYSVNKNNKESHKINKKDNGEPFFVIVDTVYELDSLYLESGFNSLFKDKSFLKYRYDNNKQNVKDCLFNNSFIYKFIKRNDRFDSLTFDDRKRIEEYLGEREVDVSIIRIFFSEILFYKEQFALVQIIYGGKVPNDFGNRYLCSFIFKQHKKTKKWKLDEAVRARY